MVGEVNGTGFKNGPFNASGGGTIRVGGDAVTRMAFVGATFTTALSAGMATPLPGNYTHPDGSAGGNWCLCGASGVGSPLLYQPVFLTAWGINNEWPAASSLHVGGCQVVMADGSVRFVSQNINWITWNNLNSRNAQDLVGDF
jgi:prepilin-type processing-associated H-X9-DG protein